MLDWLACPHCTREVPVVAGVLGAHTVPREMRRWPKLGEECRLSGKPLLETMPDPEPHQGAI